MSTAALRIEQHGVVETLQLPDTPTAQRAALAEAVGGDTDTGFYHRQAVLHVHGNGAAAQDLQFNATAWALASAWRGLDIPYGLYGPIVVTGPAGTDNGYGPLAPGLQAQVHAKCVQQYARFTPSGRPALRRAKPRPVPSCSQQPGTESLSAPITPPPGRVGRSVQLAGTVWGASDRTRVMICSVSGSREIS